jgi:AcrR family transcriptional regulator
VREWVPISSSAKGRLALHALEDFGQKGFEAVNVVDIAAAAGVTTGSLYHHFGSKVGLYTFVRAEAERRLLDRMEGAAAATRAGDGRAAAMRAALLIGFDFATSQGFMRLLGEPHPARSATTTAPRSPACSRERGERRLLPSPRERRSRPRARRSQLSPSTRRSCAKAPLLTRKPLQSRLGPLSRTSQQHRLRAPAECWGRDHTRVTRLELVG